MKSCLMLLAAGLVTSIATLAGCTSAQLQSAQTAAQKLQSDVTAACNVIQPAIDPFAPFLVSNAAVTAFNTDVTLACSGNALLNLTSLNNVINSSGAVAKDAVALIPNLTKEQIAVVQGLIGAFQGSLKNAVAAYQSSATAVTTTVPTSASAPVAASS